MSRRMIVVFWVVVAVLAGGTLADAGIIVGKTDLATDTPGVTGGEGGGAHQVTLYRNAVMPASGMLTKVTLRNDSDTNSEQFGVLVLRPTGTPDQYTVIHNQQFTGEDDDNATTGTRDYPTLLPVEADDVLAHWWPLSAQNPGPIPFTNFSSPAEGPGVFKWPVTPGEVEPGDTFNFNHTGGGLTRDYFLNATLESGGMTVGKLDLLTDPPSHSGGDGGSAEVLFLHQGYVIPSPGRLTALTLLNDSDTNNEQFDLLVVRPTGSPNEYTVIHRVPILDEDDDGATTGTRTYALDSLAVASGDILGMWWDAQNPGPIPFDNNEGTTVWEWPVTSVGDTFTFSQTGGPREYFMNVTLRVPEPATVWLFGLGAIALAACGWRKRFKV